MINRRKFIEELTGSAAGLFIFSCGQSGFAQAALQSIAKKERRKITVGGKRVLTVDVHAHCYSMDVWKLVKDRDDSRLMKNILDRQGPDFDLQNIAGRIKQMDSLGIDVQALSVAPELHYWAEHDLAQQIVQVENEQIAAVCSANAGRFVGIGGLSLQHVDLALTQLDKGVKDLGLRGFLIGGSVNGEELSSEKFNPVWAKAEELGTVIFIHPRSFPEAESRFKGNGYLSNVIGHPLETTVALSHLIFDGTLDRFPKLKICAYHGGGYLPSYIGRSDFCAEFNPKDCIPIKKRPSEYLRQLYFDSLVFSPEGLRHLVAEAGADRILLGTDYPTPMGTTRGVDHILGTSTLSDSEKAAILGDNARRLLNISAQL